MRRRAKKRNPYTVSLFPFLAVLICTLGVLIIMLVMAVHSAEKDGLESLKEVQANELKTIDALTSQLDTKALKVDLLSQSRPDVLKRLRDIRLHRGQIAADVKRLDNEMRELQLQKASMISTDFDTSAEISDVQLTQLEQELSAAIAERDAVAFKAQQSAANMVYWIIPSGDSGAQRRPIYVECKREAIILQPFGIELTAEDFVRPVLAGNPFDVALTAISQYWRHQDLAGESGAPYPLLVVRPGGEQSYLVARHAMKSWEDEFGYELIESEKVIDFGQQDSLLKSELIEVIANAREKQAAMAAQRVLRRNSYGDGSQIVDSGTRDGIGDRGQSGLVASPGKGGFVQQGRNQNRPYRGSANSDSSDTASESRSGKALAQSSSDSTQSSTQSKSKNGTGEGTSSIGNETPPVQPLAQHRGANWALPDHANGATAYSRPIRIFCSDKEFVIRSTAGPDLRVPFDGSIVQDVDKLVDGIWQTIERWGSAGQNGYWKPRLRITVLPGGNTSFANLRQLLDQSGLEIEQFQDTSGSNR